MSAIPETRPLRGRVNGKDVLFVRVGDQVRCIEDACPHMGLSLAEAEIEPDHTLSCPWHGMVFDCLTGACLSSPGEHLTILPLQIADGRVRVRVQASGTA